MSLVEDTLNKAVRDIVNLIIGTPGFAIKANQDESRPSTPYCSVHTMTIMSIGIEEQILTDQVMPDLDIDSRREGYREVMFSLNFLFGNALSNAEQVKIGLTRNSITEFLRAADLGLANRSEVRAMSEPLENGIEERAQFDFVLSAIGTDDDVITSIASLTISGDFQTRGISIPVTIEVQ